LDHINELEFINGDIFANIYMTNTIVQLDLQRDSVKRAFDFSFLELKANQASNRIFHRYLNEGECLNGIAYNRKTKTLLLTGKHWPVMFDVAWDDPMFG